MRGKFLIVLGGATAGFGIFVSMKCFDNKALLLPALCASAGTRHESLACLPSNLYLCSIVIAALQTHGRHTDQKRTPQSFFRVRS